MAKHRIMTVVEEEATNVVEEEEVVVVVKRILEQKKTGNVANSAGAQIRNGTEGILSGGKDDHSL